MGYTNLALNWRHKLGFEMFQKFLPSLHVGCNGDGSQHIDLSSQFEYPLQVWQALQSRKLSPVVNCLYICNEKAKSYFRVDGTNSS